MIRNFIELFYRTYKYSFYCKLSYYHLDKSKLYIADESKIDKWKKHVIKVCKYNRLCGIEEPKIDKLQQYFRERIKGLI